MTAQERFDRVRLSRLAGMNDQKQTRWTLVAVCLAEAAGTEDDALFVLREALELGNGAALPEHLATFASRAQALCAGVIVADEVERRMLDLIQPIGA